MIKNILLALSVAALIAGCACDSCKKTDTAAAPVTHSHGKGKDAKNY